MDLSPRKLPQGSSLHVIDCRVPAHIIDILNLASFALGERGAKYPSRLLQYYLQHLSQENFSRRDLEKRMEHGLLKGKAQRPVHLKSQASVNAVATLKIKARTNDTADVVKLAVLKIYEDILRYRNPDSIKQLKQQMANGNR